MYSSLGAGGSANSWGIPNYSPTTAGSNSGYGRIAAFEMDDYRNSDTGSNSRGSRFVYGRGGGGVEKPQWQKLAMIGLVVTGLITMGMFLTSGSTSDNKESDETFGYVPEIPFVNNNNIVDQQYPGGGGGGLRGNNNDPGMKPKPFPDPHPDDAEHDKEDRPWMHPIPPSHHDNIVHNNNIPPGGTSLPVPVVATGAPVVIIDVTQHPKDNIVQVNSSNPLPNKLAPHPIPIPLTTPPQKVNDDVAAAGGATNIVQVNITNPLPNKPAPHPIPLTTLPPKVNDNNDDDATKNNKNGNFTFEIIPFDEPNVPSSSSTQAPVTTSTSTTTETDHGMVETSITKQEPNGNNITITRASPEEDIVQHLINKNNVTTTATTSPPKDAKTYNPDTELQLPLKPTTTPTTTTSSPIVANHSTTDDSFQDNDNAKNEKQVTKESEPPLQELLLGPNLPNLQPVDQSQAPLEQQQQQEESSGEFFIDGTDNKEEEQQEELIGLILTFPPEKVEGETTTKTLVDKVEDKSEKDESEDEAPPENGTAEPVVEVAGPLGENNGDSEETDEAVVKVIVDETKKEDSAGDGELDKEATSESPSADPLEAEDKGQEEAKGEDGELLGVLDPNLEEEFKAQGEGEYLKEQLENNEQEATEEEQLDDFLEDGDDVILETNEADDIETANDDNNDDENVGDDGRL